MKRGEVHTLVLSAGPAGLAPGYTPAKAGLSPVVLERDKACGGLMRSICRGGFVVDDRWIDPLARHPVGHPGARA